jgi:carbon storage regulator CsrA
MLVLSRRVGQEIFIGDIRVIVVGHDGRRVRLAIDAPPEVKILRQELIGQASEPVIAARTFEPEVALA